jgi:hypothetical protein
VKVDESGLPVRGGKITEPCDAVRHFRCNGRMKSQEIGQDIIGIQIKGRGNDNRKNLLMIPLSIF